MAPILLTTTAFEKDLRRVEKQGKGVDKLEEVVNSFRHSDLCRPAAGHIGCAESGRDIGTAISSSTGSCSTE